MKRRQDRGSHGRSQELKDFILEPDNPTRSTKPRTNICNLSRLGGYCLSKRLDAIFIPSRVLYEER